MKQHLKSPLITEKNTVLAEAGTYVFQVDLSSTKEQIKKEINLFKAKGYEILNTNL